MKPHRKKARDYLMAIRTKEELLNYLNELTISEEQKQIVIDIYGNGLSHQQIAFKYNISIEKSRKIIQKVLDKVL